MKKLKVYNIKRKFLAFVLTTTMIGSVAVGLSGCSKSIDMDTETIISTIHEEDLVESDILCYIEISDNLNKLNLGRFILDEDITLELDSPENIQKYIDKYDQNNITCLRYLKMQEILVNSYIYKTGYSVANKNVEEATKKYAIEFYGMENYKDITINYNNPSNHSVTNQPEDHVWMNYPYNYITESITVTDKNIKIGALATENTKTNSDPDKSDNNLYNKDRNKEIKNAIIVAEYLNNQVENDDLYNEKAAKKIKR